MKKEIFRQLLEINSKVVFIAERTISNELSAYSTTDIVVHFQEEAKQVYKTFPVLGNSKTSVIQTLKIRDYRTREERNKFYERVEKAKNKYDKWLTDLTAR